MRSDVQCNRKFRGRRKGIDVGRIMVHGSRLEL